MNTNPAKDKGNKDKGKEPFDREKFKKGVAYVESDNGKFLWNDSSTATGKYQFLYSGIKNLAIMKGVTREQFRDNPELQEKIMDMAIDNKLKDRPGYFKNAKDLTNEFSERFGSDWNYRPDEVALLTHFLGRQGARDYLKSELLGKEYKVPGKNMKVNDYLKRYNKSIGSERGISKPKEPLPEVRDPRMDALLNSEFEGNIGIQDSTSPMNINPNIYNRGPINYQEPIEVPKVNNPGGNNRDSNPFVQETQAQWLEKYLGNNQFAMGGSMPGMNLNQNELIEYNEGGSHESNPYGGIPQGMGSNGKMNTVEEGETSFKLKNGKFVFSDRLGFFEGEVFPSSDTNSFANGGYTDPIKKKKNGDKEDSFSGTSDKKWYNNWINSPEARKRLDSTNKLYNNSSTDIDELLRKSNKNLGSVAVYGKDATDQQIVDYHRHKMLKNYDAENLVEAVSEINKPSDDPMAMGFYTPELHSIKMFKDKNDDEYGVTMAHELTHGAEDFQVFNDNVIDKIAKKRTVDEYINNIAPNGSDSDKDYLRGFYEYLQEDGVYPRVMELRNKYNLKPGQKVKKEDLRKFKETQSDLFDLYSDDDVIKIMNTVADNTDINSNVNVAAKGGYIDSGCVCDCPGKPPCPPATRKDSLDVYNNAMKIQKYLKDNNYKLTNEHKLDPYFDLRFEDGEIKIPLEKEELIGNQDFDRLVKRNDGYYLKPSVGRRGPGVKEGEVIGKEFPFLKSIGNNKYLAGGTESTGGANIDIPLMLLDSRIPPRTSKYYFMNHNGERDADTFLAYDPLEVKPADMLTPEERELRIKKYGKDGLVSKEKKKDKPKPKPKKKRAKEVSSLKSEGFDLRVSPMDFPESFEPLFEEDYWTVVREHQRPYSRTKYNVYNPKEMERLRRFYKATESRGTKLKVTPHYKRRK